MGGMPADSLVARGTLLSWLNRARVVKVIRIHTFQVISRRSIHANVKINHQLR